MRGTPHRGKFQAEYNGLSDCMKQDAAFFAGKEPILVYIARRLRDAVRLESLLTEAGVDYGVEADEYEGGVIFRSHRVGAFFYVMSDTVEAAHRVMRANGYRPQPPESRPE